MSTRQNDESLGPLDRLYVMAKEYCFAFEHTDPAAHVEDILGAAKDADRSLRLAEHDSWRAVRFDEDGRLYVLAGPTAPHQP